jgi:hypothetical protein
MSFMRMHNVAGALVSPKGMSQPHFEGSVRSPFTFSKMGLGSPPGLLKTQNAIARVNTPRCKVFFILLERSWSVDVRNGLAWAIWTSAAQVMVERRVNSRPLKLGNRPDPGVCRWSATHHWKNLKESYNFTSDLVPIGGWSEKLWTPKVPGVQTRIVSGLHFGSLGTNSHLSAGAME